MSRMFKWTSDLSECLSVLPTFSADRLLSLRRTILLCFFFFFALLHSLSRRGIIEQLHSSHSGLISSLKGTSAPVVEK